MQIPIVQYGVVAVTPYRRKIKMKKCFFILCFLFGCGEPAPEFGDEREEFEIGGTHISIPKKYFLSGLRDSIATDERELDKETSFALIQVPLVDLGIDVTLEGGLLDKIIARLYQVNGRVNPAAVDAWHGVGLYKNGIIEFDSEVGLYRVYGVASYPRAWQYFKSSPVTRGDFASNWVSSCLARRGSDGKDLAKIRCKAIYRYKTVESSISISGENMAIREAIFSGYTKMLQNK